MCHGGAGGHAVAPPRVDDNGVMTLSSDVLITATELAAALRTDRPPVLLDVRWALGDPDGHRHYLAGHLPGAVHVDLDTELAAPAAPEHGRHPLPDLGQLQAAARRWGVHDGDAVVAYDDNGNLAAARAWWLLRWAGLTEVRLLDGGLAAWTAAGLPVESGQFAPVRGDVVLHPGALPVVDAEGAAQVARVGVLLDARAPERYRGENEPVDPRAGHIPGAVSAPTAGNLAPDGRFQSPAELAARFAAFGLTRKPDAGGGEASGDGANGDGASGDSADGDADRPVAVYCGSGVTASHEIVALHLAGIDAALYPGSWSQWSSDPARPVATGPGG